MCSVFLSHAHTAVLSTAAVLLRVCILCLSSLYFSNIPVLSSFVKSAALLPGGRAEVSGVEDAKILV